MDEIMELFHIIQNSSDKSNIELNNVSCSSGGSGSRCSSGGSGSRSSSSGGGNSSSSSSINSSDDDNISS